MRYYALSELKVLPTLETGWVDDLKIRTPNTRLWLSRLTTADGMPYDNQVTIEELRDGKWITVASYRPER